MKLLNHLHIPVKMAIPAATSLICVLVVALLGGSAILEQSRLLDSLFNRSFSREAEVQQLTDALTVSHAALYRTVILSTANATPQAVEAEAKAVGEHLALLQKTADTVRKNTPQDDREAKFFERFGADTASYTAQVTSFLDLLKVGVDPMDFMQQLQSAYGSLNTVSRDYLADQRARAADDYAVVNDSVAVVTNAFVAVAASGLLLTIAVAALIGVNVARPVVRLTGAMQSLANGQLEVAIPGGQRGDEIGQMARTVQVFKENALRIQEMAQEQEATRARNEQEQRAAMIKIAGELEASVKSTLHQVLRSADSMRGEADAMLDNAKATTVHSDTVAHAVQEATGEVESVAAGAEQLRASIDEINRSITLSADLARGAVDEAGRTDGIVQGLTDASRKIEEVVGLINTIASRTNLLALNATIEAARAGEAGRGFAVVASEVKSLANQTAKATEDIGTEIAAVQTATAAAVNAIRAIASTIRQVDQSLSTVAAAVEEQEAATREISMRSQRAATDTAAVMHEMRLVQAAAETTGRSAGTVQTTSTGLAQSFTRLDQEVEAFLLRITA